jgi:hypothetical protein
MKSSIYQKNIHSKVIDLDDEGVIYRENSDDEKLIANATAMAIWDLLNGQRTSYEIAQEIALACGVKCEEIENDIYDQLTQFSKLQLIDEKKDEK